jgi:zinc/manganese transport system permease protein
VTSFVRIAGVLLVFSYLIVPAVCGINLADSLGKQFFIGCLVALAGGIGGLFLSFRWDLPSGAAIVCTFGVLLVLLGVIGIWRRRFAS